MRNIQNKSNEWALITGAAGGIGLHFAKILASEGTNLILVDRKEPELNALAEGLKKDQGVEVKVILADLVNTHQVQSLIEKVKELQVDILINNAGIGLYGKFSQTDISEEMNMIQLNITTLTQLTKAVLPQMQSRGSGRILNLASTASFQPGPTMAVYFATKAYVLFFSEAIANELSGTGISVTALCPGPTESGFQTAAQAGSSKLFNKKLPRAEDIALKGLKAMRGEKRVYIPGFLNWIGAQSVRLVPRKMAAEYIRRIL